MHARANRFTSFPMNKIIFQLQLVQLGMEHTEISICSEIHTLNCTYFIAISFCQEFIALLPYTGFLLIHKYPFKRFRLDHKR